MRRRWILTNGVRQALPAWIFQFERHHATHRLRRYLIRKIEDFPSITRQSVF